MSRPIRVVQYGLGPIGQACLRVVLAKQDAGAIELVGAIDIDPDKVGRDVADLLGRDRATGITIQADADAVLAETKPDVVLHTTTSFLARMHEQLTQCARHGVHVVSSTEELSFPYDRHPELSEELDRVAKENGVTILGTGVNPGYAMDALALMATGVCVDVRSLRVERVVDAAHRREPLQRKVGAGLTEAAFAEKKATGTFGHIGLRESLLMVAKGLGVTLDRVEETLDPVISDRRVETPYLTVEEGDVAGIHHAIAGYRGEDRILALDLKMYVGARDPKDAVYADSDPAIEMVVPGGIFGDTATVGALVNALPLVRETTPGLKTMLDVPVGRAFAPSMSGSLEPAPVA